MGKDVFEILRNLARMDSQEERKDFIADLLKRRGVAFEDSYNIYVPPTGKPELFLDAHIDTVKRVSPFRELPDRFEGTGVADNLGNVSVILKLLLERGNLPGMEVILSVDEEEGGTGAAEAEPEAPAGIVFEPTGLKVWNRHMGAVEVEFELEDEKLHASYGNGMLKKLSDRLSFYTELEGSGVSVNILSICGDNGDIYATLGRCTAKVELIVEPEADFEAILKSIPDSIGDADRGFVEEDTDFLPEPIRVLERGTCPSWTNAIEYRKKGKKVVVFGAGNLMNCHTEREFILKRELLDGYRILRESVKDRAGKGVGA